MTRNEPPLAPTIERRLDLTWRQRIGLPLIAAIPLLALFGLFGERSATIHTSSAALELRVTYPERFRYRQSQRLEIVVRNIARRSIDTIHVSIDTAYLSRFSTVHIEPAPRTSFVVDVTNVSPGESRLIAVELSGDRYGRHGGRISAATSEDSVVIPIRTFVFP
jgi:hypothetical protein